MRKSTSENLYSQFYKIIEKVMFDQSINSDSAISIFHLTIFKHCKFPSLPVKFQQKLRLSANIVAQMKKNSNL